MRLCRRGTRLKRMMGFAAEGVFSGSSREQRRAYLLLRLLTGLDFFGHGFARIATGTHLSGFAMAW